MFWLADSFKKCVANFILKKLVGNFLKSEPKNIGINITGGHFSLENIDLNVDYINTFLRDVPITLEKGSISKISVTTPWRNILSESMTVEVDGIDLTAIFDNVQSSGQTHSVLERSHVPPEVLASSILLGDFGSEEVEEEFKELETTPESSGAEGMEESGMSGIARVIDKVVSNIKAKVTDATFRVRFPASELHENPILLLNIPELEYFDETPQDNEFKDDTHKWFSSLMVKVIRFQGFNLQLYEDDLESSFNAKSQSAIHDGHTIAFGDTDNEVRVQLYTGSPLEKCLPFLDVKCFVSALHCVLEPKHFRMVMDIMESVKSNLPKSDQHSKAQVNEEQSSLYKTVEGSGTYSSLDFDNESSSGEAFSNISMEVPSPEISSSSENNHMERAEHLLSPNSPSENEESQFFSMTSSFHYSEIPPQELSAENVNNSLKINLQIQKATCRVLYENVDLTKLWSDFISSDDRKNKDPIPEADHLCVSISNLDINSENNQDLNELTFSLDDINIYEKLITNQIQEQTFRHLLSFINSGFGDLNNNVVYGKLRFEKTVSKFNNEIEIKPLKFEVDLGVAQRIANLIKNSRPNLKSETELPPNVDFNAFEDSHNNNNTNKTKENVKFSSYTKITLQYLGIVVLCPIDPQDPTKGVKSQQLGAEIHNMQWTHEHNSTSGISLLGTIKALKVLLINNERESEKVVLLTECDSPELLKIDVTVKGNGEKEGSVFQSVKFGDDVQYNNNFDINSDDLDLSGSEGSSNSLHHSQGKYKGETSDEDNIDIATKQEKLIQSADVSIMVNAPCAQVDLNKSDFFVLHHMIEDISNLLISPFTSSPELKEENNDDIDNLEDQHEEKIIVIEFTLSEGLLSLHAPGGIANPTGDLQADLATRSMHDLEAALNEFKVLTTIHSKKDTNVSLFISTDELDLSEVVDHYHSIPLLRKHPDLEKDKQFRKPLVVDISLDPNPSLLTAKIYVALSNMLMNHYVTSSTELWFMCLANFFDESIEDPEVVSSINLHLNLDVVCKNCAIDYKPVNMDGRLLLLFEELGVSTTIPHNEPKFLLTIDISKASALLHNNFEYDLITYYKRNELRHNKYATNLKELGFAQVVGLDHLCVELFINKEEATRKDPPLLVRITSNQKKTLEIDFCSDSLGLLKSIISTLSPSDSEADDKQEDDGKSSNSTFDVTPGLYPTLSNDGGGIETAMNEALPGKDGDSNLSTEPISNVSRVSDFKIYEGYVTPNGGHKPLNMENMIDNKGGIRLKEQEDNVVKMADNFTNAISRLSISEEDTQSPDQKSSPPKPGQPSSSGPPLGIPIHENASPYHQNINQNYIENKKDENNDSEDEWIHTDAEFLRQREQRNEHIEENEGSPVPAHLVYVDKSDKEEAHLYQPIHHIEDYIPVPSFADRYMEHTLSDTYPIPTFELVLCKFDIKVRLYAGEEWPKNKHTEEKETTPRRLIDGSQWTGSTRDYYNFVELNVDDIYLQYDTFDEQEDYAWRLNLFTANLTVLKGNNPFSENKELILGYLSNIPRSRMSRIIDITTESLRTDKKNPTSQDLCLDVDVLPLKVHINQNTLMFLLDFFLSPSEENKEECEKEEEKEKEEGLTKEPMKQFEGDKPQDVEVDARNAIYFQKVRISNIRLNIDYEPTHVDYQKLRKGGYTELANFVQIRGLDLELRAAEVEGAVGTESLVQSLTEIWLPDVSGTQLFRCLLGVMPIRSVYNLGSGLADLVVVPLNQYQRDGRVFRGFQKGFSSFMTNFGGETMGITAQISSRTRSLLSAIQSSLLGEDHTASAQVNMPNDAVEGFQQAYASISRGFSHAGCAVFAITNEYNTGGTYGAARSAAQAVPVAVLSPMIGATEALSRVTLGLRNWWDPARKREHDDIYRH